MNTNIELLEIKLLVDKKIIMETTSRIGIANKKNKILYPSCYLYSRDNKDYLVHFKEMFMLTRENAYNNICEEDIVRKNAVAFCLKNWGLIEVEDEDIEPHNKFVFVLAHQDREYWKISHKFNFKSINTWRGMPMDYDSIEDFNIDENDLEDFEDFKEYYNIEIEYENENGDPEELSFDN